MKIMILKRLIVLMIAIQLSAVGCSRVDPPVENEFLNETKMRSGPIKEFPMEPESVAAADERSARCFETMREFLNYIHSATPSLFFNQEAMERWLTADLRSAAANHLNVDYGVAASENPPHTFPGNHSFYGAWDAPTSFSVLKVREDEIEIRYYWGHGTNYEGTTRDVVFMFAKEDGNCKINDLHHKKADFSSEFWLKTDLRKWTYE